MVRAERATLVQHAVERYGLPVVAPAVVAANVPGVPEKLALHRIQHRPPRLRR